MGLQNTQSVNKCRESKIKGFVSTPYRVIRQETCPNPVCRAQSKPFIDLKRAFKSFSHAAYKKAFRAFQR